MGSANSHLEDRDHARIATRLKVRFGIETADREAYAENLSEGGLYLNTNRVFNIGTRLIVRIEFPQRTIVHLGEVAWAIQVPDALRSEMVCGMGISFIRPCPEWRAFLTETRETVAHDGAEIESRTPAASTDTR